LLFKLFVKVRYISLVNLIAGREVVRELLMQRLNEKNLYRELSRVLPDGPSRDEILRGYDEVNRRLGEPGASGRFASMIIDALHDDGAR
jgi:lipid-A-disaccharide synthase